MPRIVSWNMSHWQKTAAQRREAWDYLRSLEVDFALLQETVPPAELHPHAYVYRPEGIDRNRRWGSAIVSFGDAIEPVLVAKSRHGKTAVNLHGTFTGSVAIAITKGGFTLISLYTVMEQGYAIITLHRQLSDLTPMFDSPLGRRVVLAGDLNISTQFPEPDRSRHRNALERIAAFDMVDAFGIDRPPRERLDGCPCEDRPCRHVQTQRHGRSKIPWQNDYFFVSKALVPKVKSCIPVHEGYPWLLSDHSPILLEL